MAYDSTKLSYSRINKYAQCPWRFKLHYLDALPSEPQASLQFGTVVHAACEQLIRDLLRKSEPTRLSPHDATEALKQAWIQEGLTDVALFAEGLRIVKNFAEKQGVLDPANVLAVEGEFDFPVGDFRLVGKIDRVDKIDDETLHIIDYKTNHQLFTCDELDCHLQLSLYQAAAQRLWPWARKFKLTLLMLRHGLELSTTRTPEQIEAALEYVQTIGKVIQRDATFEPRISPLCAYCEYRSQCSAYAVALRDNPKAVGGDLNALAIERREVSTRARLLAARQQELDGLLKAELKHRDEITAGGTRYSMTKMAHTEYPYERTLALIAQATGKTVAEIVPKVAVIDGKALANFVADAGSSMEKPRHDLLRAELAAVADVTYTPRLLVKSITD